MSEQLPSVEELVAMRRKRGLRVGSAIDCVVDVESSNAEDPVPVGVGLLPQSLSRANPTAPTRSNTAPL